MTPSHGRRIACLLAFATFALGSLLSGASFLEAALPGGLPLGNALVGLGLCAVAGAALIAARGPVRWIAFVALIVAASWLPVSIAMAGNLALVFSGERGDAWISWSTCVVAFVLFTFALATLHRGIAAARRRSMRDTFDVR